MNQSTIDKVPDGLKIAIADFWIAFTGLETQLVSLYRLLIDDPYVATLTFYRLSTLAKKIEFAKELFYATEWLTEPQKESCNDRIAREEKIKILDDFFAEFLDLNAFRNRLAHRILSQDAAGDWTLSKLDFGKNKKPVKQEKVDENLLEKNKNRSIELANQIYSVLQPKFKLPTKIELIKKR